MRSAAWVCAGLLSVGLAGGVRAEEPASSAAPWHEGLFPPARIYVEPLVLPAAQDQQALRGAAARVEAVFGVPVTVRLPEVERPDVPNALGAPYRAGDRLLFPPIAAAMQYTWRRDPGLPDALAVIAVSGAPIGFPARDGRIIESATWSMRGQGIAAVSLPLLLADLTGPTAPAELVEQRLAKAMARMLGQALGLSDGDAVMRRPATPTALDEIPLMLSDTTRIELAVVRALCAVADGRVSPDALEAVLVERPAATRDAAAATLAILLERREAPEAADAVRDAIGATPTVARLHLSRARLAYRAGEWANAADAWDRVLALHPYARTWAAQHSVDWLLTHQGLPGRADGAARPVWHDPVEQAQTALDTGDAATAADAAQVALTRELHLATQQTHTLFAERNAAGRAPASAVGIAAALRAVALARLEQWDEAAEALTIAQDHLSEHAREQVTHVAVRVSVGRGDAPTWETADRSSWTDRLRTGLEARHRGDVVAALDAWTPLLAALETPWSPNVPVRDLAEAYVAHGDPVRARDVLVRAAQAGVLGDEVRVHLAALPGPAPLPVHTPIPGRVRQHAVRRFQPALAATANTIWVGTSGGLLRVDRDTTKATLQHAGHGLPPGRIRALALTEAGLWLGSTTGLYRRVDQDPWHRIVDPVGLPLPAVTALLPDAEGAVLAGTEAGLCRVTADGDVSWTDGLPRGRVAALTRRADTTAVSFVGLGPAVGRNGTWQQVAAPNPVGVHTWFGGVALDKLQRLMLIQGQEAGVAICRETPFAVYCDDLPPGTSVAGPVAAADGTLWLAAGNELGQWDRGMGWEPAATLPEDAGPVRALVPDVQDALWVVTSHTLYRFADGQFDALVQFAERNIWRTLLRDPRGAVWKVFSPNVYPPPDVTGPSRLPAGSAGDAGGMVLDDAGVPWAVADGRLYRAHGAVWQAVADVPERAAQCRLHVVSGNRVWAGNETGAWRWSADTGWTAYAPPENALPDAPRVRDVVVTEDGRTWIAWMDRVEVIDGAKREIAPLPRRTILGLAVTGNAVWVATAHDGVYRLGATVDHWSRADGLPDDRVPAIAAADATVWAAGAHGGVAQWDGTRWVRHHVANLAVPLVADTIVPETGGTVWFQVGETWYEHAAAQ